jgi:hypothetical protein
MSSQTHSREVSLNVSVSPVKILTTSTPTTPGTTLPSGFPGLPLVRDDAKVPGIEPPARPKSTPFSLQETANVGQAKLFGNDCDLAAEAHVVEGGTPVVEDGLPQTEKVPKLTFSLLPTEIHELILDHVFGVRGSVLNSPSSSRSWSTALRHSRRRQLADVALVSRRYRELVQERLFKHSK